MGRVVVYLPGRLCPGSVIASAKAGALVDLGGHGVCAAGERRVGETGLVVVPCSESVGHSVRLPDLELAALECGTDLFWLGTGAPGQRAEGLS
ncbi:hypothetical protein D3C85_1147030 [compost metagenome]